MPIILSIFLGNELGYFAVRKGPYRQVIVQGGMCLSTLIRKNIVDFTSIAHWVLITVSTITSVSGH